MLKLKLQYCGYLMWRTDSFEKTLMLGKIQGKKRKDDRGWDGWMASPTQWTWVWVRSGSWWWTGKPGVLQSMGSQRVRLDWATELNWTNPFPTLQLDFSFSKDGQSHHPLSCPHDHGSQCPCSCGLSGLQFTPATHPCPSHSPYHSPRRGTVLGSFSAWNILIGSSTSCSFA